MDESYLKKQRLNPGLPSENFNDNLNNFSMNKSNINNYLYYLNKWTNDIKENPKNAEILNKYVGTAFAFIRDLQKYPTLRQINYELITPSDIVNKIKDTNKFIIDNLLTGDITNQAKFIELNRNLNSGNFKGGKKRRTLRRKSNKKMKKTYKKRRVSRRKK
jgi:hypothetical protein